MSGGGGGGNQMPMASNRGQQQQMGQMAPRVGWMPQDAVGGRGSQMDPRFQQGGVFGQPQMAQQMPPQGGMFGGQTPTPRFDSQQAYDQFMAQGGGGMQPAMGAGMASMPRFANQQAYDDFMAQGGMQGMQDRMAGIGGLLDGGQQVPMGGPEMFPYRPQVGDMPSGPGRGYTVNDGPMMPPGAGYPQPTNTTMPLPRRGLDGVGDGTGPGGMGFGFPRNMPPDPRLGFDDFRKGDLPGRGMPPAYGPTKGPIDGRKLRDMIDIRKRRVMDDKDMDRGLPGSARDRLPPSLIRPTQGGYRGYK